MVCAGEVAFEYRGVAIVSYNSTEYIQTTSTDAIDAIPATGATWVSMMTTWYMDTPAANTIAVNPEKTPTDEGLRKAIADAHAKGLKVMLKPQVDVADESWRGAIAPQSVAAWFDSYRAFILRYAALAQETGCEMFCVGCEFKSLSGAQNFTEWKKTIDAIRQKYNKGPLTYAANAYLPGDEYSTVSFWPELDIAGLDVYTPLTNSNNPTFDQLVAGWTNNHLGANMLSALRGFSQTVGKPVIFAEMGYQSSNGCNINPNGVPSRLLDLQEQADCFKAALTVWGAEPWLQGIFWWGWEVTRIDSLRDSHYSVRGKPAQDVLASFYKKSTVVTPSGSGIIATPSLSETGMAVKFVSTIIDTSGGVLKYAWNFGDGNTSTDPEPTIVYNVAGTYSVTVTVTDNTGKATAGTLTYQVVDNLEKLKASTCSIGLNYAKANSDALKLTVLLPLTDPTPLLNSELIVNVGGATQTIPIDAKGKGISADQTCQAKVSAKAKNGLTVVAFSFKKATLAASFSDEGLTSTDVSNKVVKIGVTLQALGVYYVNTMPLSYSARAQKTGRATLIKK